MWWRAVPHVGLGVGAALPPPPRPLPRGSCSRRRGQAPRGDDGRTPAARPVTGWPQVRERKSERAYNEGPRGGPCPHQQKPSTQCFGFVLIEPGSGSSQKSKSGFRRPLNPDPEDP